MKAVLRSGERAGTWKKPSSMAPRSDKAAFVPVLLHVFIHQTVWI